MQGDHFQVNLKKFTQDPVNEVEAVKGIIKEGIEGGFYNIDIDTSTVVDLSKLTIKKQQEKKLQHCGRYDSHDPGYRTGRDYNFRWW